VKNESTRVLASVALLGCALGLAVLISGCGNSRQSPASADGKSVGSSKPTQALSPVYVVPYTYAATLPAQCVPAGEGWYCEWDMGDGSRYRGANVRHKYTGPGHYSPSWTVHSGDRITASGEAEIELLSAVDASCAQRSQYTTLTDIAREAGRDLGTDATQLVGIPSWAGFALISRSPLKTVGLVPIDHGLEPPPQAEAEDCVFTYYGAVVYAMSKATGKTVFQIDFEERTSSRVDVMSIAYSREHGELFVLVYPRGDEEVAGSCYTIRNGTWAVTKLPQLTPKRPYTAGFEMVADDKCDALLVVAGGIWASSRVFVLSYDTGGTIGEVAIPRSGFRGVHLDSERQNLWLADGKVVLRLILDPRGIPIHSAGAELECLAITVDDETGDCYCLLNTDYTTQPARLAVFSEDGTLRFTASVDGVAANAVATLDPYGMCLQTLMGKRLLLIAGREVYAIEVSTMQLTRTFPLEIDTWILGQKADGTVLLQPQALDLWLLPRGSRTLQHLAQMPPSLGGYEGQLLDACWDPASGTAILLFPGLAANWDPTTGRVETLSLAEYVPDSQQSTLRQMGIVSCPTGSIAIIRLPGKTAKESAVYRLDWKRKRLTSIAGSVPTDSALGCSYQNDALWWVEAGTIRSTSATPTITLPENVRWDEQVGTVTSLDSTTAAVLSSSPSGLLALVDLADHRVSGILDIGSQSEQPVLQLAGKTLWIAAHDSLLRVDLAGTSPVRCFRVPYSLGFESSSDLAKGRLRVGLSAGGNVFVLTSFPDGVAYVLEDY